MQENMNYNRRCLENQGIQGFIYNVQFIIKKNRITGDWFIMRDMAINTEDVRGGGATRT